MNDEEDEKIAAISLVFCGFAFLLGLIICIILSCIFSKIEGLCAFALMLVSICILLLKVAKNIMKERDEKSE